MQKLQDLQNKLSLEQHEAFVAALTREAARRAHQFMTGIKAYRHYPKKRSLPPMPIIWQSGTTVVRDYNPDHPLHPAVFIIPSLINRFDILDLDFDLSFLRWIATQGFRPLVVDWGSPGDEEAAFGLSDYITRRLVPALHHISTARNPVHIVGYCMGGLLAAAVGVLAPQFVQSLTFMATPWDFHNGDAKLGIEYQIFAEKIMPHLKQMRQMPVDIIQSLFSISQPFKVMDKFAAFSTLEMNSAKARHFVMLEDWLNDGVPLTAAVAQDCLVDLYGYNKTMQGQWQISGCLIDPRLLSVPSCVIVPGKDRIVPPESALPLARLLPNSTLYEPMMGHIGLMASPKAPENVWAPFKEWLQRYT